MKIDLEMRMLRWAQARISLKGHMDNAGVKESAGVEAIEEMASLG